MGTKVTNKKAADAKPAEARPPAPARDGSKKKQLAGPGPLAEQEANLAPSKDAPITKSQHQTA